MGELHVYIRLRLETGGDGKSDSWKLGRIGKWDSRAGFGGSNGLVSSLNYGGRGKHDMRE